MDTKWHGRTGITRMIEMTATKMKMRRGIWRLPWSLYQNWWLGMHPSRAIAHISCPVATITLHKQPNWEIAMIESKNAATFGLVARIKSVATGKEDDWSSSISWIENNVAIHITMAWIMARNTLQRTPLGPVLEAFSVPSAIWAPFSYPIYIIQHEHNSRLNVIMSNTDQWPSSL